MNILLNRLQEDVNVCQVIELASAKRRTNERTGIHAWHPYYAGYSELFVESAIQYLDLNKNDIVLDPWNGSGTTTTVCESLGIKSFGCDVNPAMVYFSNAKSARILKNKERILKTSIKILKLSKLHKNKVNPYEDFTKLTSLEYSRIIFSVLHSINEIYKNDPADSIFFKNKKFLEMTYEKSFLIAALFVTNRKSGFFSRGSNPTWFKTNPGLNRYKSNNFFQDYLSTVQEMLLDLKYKCKYKENFSVSFVGNVKQLPFGNKSIDAIITSPPYLTRIDYAISTKPELLLLGSSEKLRSIRENTMGSPVIIKGDLEPSIGWGKCANSIINKIANHHTKAARSYYLKNIKQYFSDAETSLNEIYRVLKKGKKALLVVQSSYFKEIEIDLGKIYAEMGVEIGFRCQVLRSEKVKNHMAYVNKASNKYFNKKVFHEDVVEFEKK